MDTLASRPSVACHPHVKSAPTAAKLSAIPSHVRILAPIVPSATCAQTDNAALSSECVPMDRNHSALPLNALNSVKDAHSATNVCKTCVVSKQEASLDRRVLVVNRQLVHVRFLTTATGTHNRWVVVTASSQADNAQPDRSVSTDYVVQLSNRSRPLHSFNRHNHTLNHQRYRLFLLLHNVQQQ